MNIPRLPSIDDGRDSDAREMSGERSSEDISRASLSRPSSILGNRGMFIVYVGPARLYINNEPAILLAIKNTFKDQPCPALSGQRTTASSLTHSSPPVLYLSSPFLSTYSRNTPAYKQQTAP